MLPGAGRPRAGRSFRAGRPVISDTTIWRALDEFGPVQLRRIAVARAKVQARMGSPGALRPRRSALP
ncbi:hypothetical protein DMB66_33235 [Actinoplanes sp. ATCC 53533]|nr:hypothetical protein DMB66_33235 [Actinoplanes sp. ATCC 53533]